MKLTKMLLALVAAAVIFAPAEQCVAQEPVEVPKVYKFSVDVGPGFLTALDDTTDAAGVEAYLALAYHPSKRFALGIRANGSTEPTSSGVGKITGDVWGFGRVYMTGLEGGLRTYTEVAVSKSLDIAVRGGAELGLVEGTAAFATVDGRKIEEDEANDLIGLGGGLRVKF